MNAKMKHAQEYLITHEEKEIVEKVQVREKDQIVVKEVRKRVNMCKTLDESLTDWEKEKILREIQLVREIKKRNAQ